MLRKTFSYCPYNRHSNQIDYVLVRWKSLDLDAQEAETEFHGSTLQLEWRFDA